MVLGDHNGKEILFILLITHVFDKSGCFTMFPDRLVLYGKLKNRLAKNIGGHTQIYSVKISSYYIPCLVVERVLYKQRCLALIPLAV